MEIKCNTLDPYGSEKDSVIEVKSGDINLLSELAISKLILNMDIDKQNELTIYCWDGEERIAKFKSLIENSEDVLLRNATIIKVTWEEN